MTRSAADSPPAPTGRRAGLDRDDIVECALQLVETEGAGALTMRKLAAELGVTTTTIYWHVGGRDELVAALIDLMSERHAALIIDGTTARQRAMAVAREVWSSALAHRNVTSLAHQVGATSRLERHLELALLRELEAAGLRGVAARDAQRAILLCVAGFLVMAMRRTAFVPLDVPDDIDLDPATIEALTSPPDLSALFDKAVQAVVDTFVPEEA